MTTVTIALPVPLKAFVDSQVASKGFGNVSEYVRSLLREAQAKEEDARLEALLLEGLASDRIPLDAEFREAAGGKGRTGARQIPRPRASVNLFVQEAAEQDLFGRSQWYAEQGVPHIARRFHTAVLVAMPDAGRPRRIGNPRLTGLRSWQVKGFDEFRVYYLVRQR